MSFKVIRGWVLTVVALLVIATGVLFVALNAGNHCNFSAFGRIVYDFNISLLMLLSAAGGVVVMWMFVLLVRGIKHIRKGRMEQAVIAAMNPPPAAPPAASESDKSGQTQG
ncbi:MAG: hypothetical protein ACE15C_09385 [Phycisphaerae bacterium]